MNCVSPPELGDGQLVSYVDGEADDPVAAHITQCSYCREKAHRLARWQNRLRARLYRLTCPSSMELGDYHLGLLAPAQTMIVAQHLQECLHCVREVAQLRDFLRELTPKPGPLEQVKILIAKLVGGRGADWPPRLAPAFAGLRGEQEEPYIYQADHAQIVIEVQDDTEQPNLKVLLGLVTGLDAQGLTIQLWQAGQRLTAIAVDEAGNFVIPHLAPGRYDLTLRGPEVEIRFPTLEV